MRGSLQAVFHDPGREYRPDEEIARTHHGPREGHGTDRPDEERAGERADEMFARLDADGDGVLSRDVLEGRMGGQPGERMLSRFDTDNSGGVSAEEFETAREKMAERRGKSRDGMGRGEGRGWGRGNH